MVLLQYNTLEELNKEVSDVVISEIQKNPSLLLCTATGNSPTGMYKKMAEKKDAFDASQLRIVKLDEWYGPPMDNPGTCEYYLRQRLLGPLNIQPQQYTGFISDAHEPVHECERIQQYLMEAGPIDLCILGIGKNGHIAFNEPAAELNAGVHVARLTDETLTHGMAKIAGIQLEFGLTLGMADILQSKKIILMVNGPHKRSILNDFLESGISTHLPASFLWLHPDVTCYYTEEG